MAAPTRYTELLGGRDPLVVMRENVDAVRTITREWDEARFNRPYAPGKWTARQVIIHLAHTELALGYRARMALATPDYVAQKFNQDAWVARETIVTGPEAVVAFAGMSRLNAALFETLSPTDRAVSMSHPEYGSITVDWIVHLLPGHQIHHITQLRT
jgi:DinB superfamily